VTFILEERNVYKNLLRKPKRKRPLGRQGLRWKDGFRMDLGVSGWGDVVYLVRSGYEPVQGYCKCGDEPAGSRSTELVTCFRAEWRHFGHVLWLKFGCPSHLIVSLPTA
jgi:hypothetical protein